MSQSFTEIFSVFQKHVEAEQDLREEIRMTVKDIEQISREILTVLQGVHQPAGLKENVGCDLMPPDNLPRDFTDIFRKKILPICKKAREMFSNVQKHYAILSTKVPNDQYYRFHDHWRFVTQRLVFLSAFIVYLESEKLIEREDAANFLGIKVSPSDGFHIDLEDFLMGLLILADELSRLAVNSVTSGDYGRPVRIAQFVTDMNSGFRLLNLKNDSLRKKFDALKYDLKKVEEVVYDLSIRGLKPADSATN